MKKCPFCAEEIQSEAIKCKHCGEFLDITRQALIAKKKLPWYFRTHTIVFAVLSIGPLALPLIWWRPHLNRNWKIGLTIGIIVLSYVLFELSVKSFEILKQYYELMENL